jgi:ATP-dependent Lon protease
VEKYSFNNSDKIDKIGVSTGLAYTEMGGDLLSLEALKFDGSGKLNTTGKLGEVMKESAQAAFSYVRSKAGEKGISSKTFNKFDFHVHVPEGATPKDGPSAGVAVAAALMSCLLDLKVRGDTAMTGEITLTGKVLPIGGLKEKLLAALRGNIKNALIPEENVKDLEKIPEKVKKEIKIIPIKTVEEAFKFLLIGYDKSEKRGRTKKNENRIN